MIILSHIAIALLFLAGCFSSFMIGLYIGYAGRKVTEMIIEHGSKKT